MKGSYAKEKIGSAVYSLATGRGDIKERLWNSFLGFHPLKESDFPDDLKDKWNDLKVRLTTEEPKYDSDGNVTTGKVENTIKKISIDDCVEIAELIYNLNYEISLK